MAPQALPQGTAGTPSTHLISHQKVEGNDRLLFSFIDWLLPHLRLRTAQASRRWDDFWKLFKADGTLGWENFERFLRWDCKLNARKLFDVLDEGCTGRISSRTVLDVRRQYERLIDCRHVGLDDLRAVLVRKYGNLMRSWRLLFDPELRGRCSHTWYMKCCREVGFHGDLKLSWAELTGGDVHRTATIKDLDPEGDMMMFQFHDALAKFHGTPRDGWFAILRSHGAFGKMSPQAFDVVCSDMKFPKRYSKVLFDMLDLNQDKNLSLDEWDFMELWGREFAKEARSKADAERSEKSNSSRQTGGASPETPPSSKGAWQLAVTGSTSEEVASPGSRAEPATIEFQVILTQEEHREYLRRRREAELNTLVAKTKSAVRTPASPSKGRTNFAASGTAAPWS